MRTVSDYPGFAYRSVCKCCTAGFLLSAQEASKIFIYFILKSLDFFIEENVVSLFHWALFVLNKTESRP